MVSTVRYRMVMAQERRRLTREDWIAAALAAIADGGLGAVAVEPLASRLGTTKGSFYWHFANREALIEAALSTWEEEHTTAVLAEVAAAPEDPVARLELLIRRVVQAAERDRIGLALLADAGHSSVGPVLTRVTRARLDGIAGIFRDLGFTPALARSRALLAYSAYLGHSQVAHSTPELLPAGRAARRAYLNDIIRVLTTP